MYSVINVVFPVPAYPEIKYIWNFTPTVLNVPDDIQVWNENLMGNFLQFTYNK